MLLAQLLPTHPPPLAPAGQGHSAKINSRPRERTGGRPMIWTGGRALRQRATRTETAEARASRATSPGTALWELAVGFGVGLPWMEVSCCSVDLDLKPNLRMALLMSMLLPAVVTALPCRRRSSHQRRQLKVLTCLSTGDWFRFCEPESQCGLFVPYAVAILLGPSSKGRRL